jgi:hypothetical protein
MDGLLRSFAQAAKWFPQLILNERGHPLRNLPRRNSRLARVSDPMQACLSQVGKRAIAAFFELQQVVLKDPGLLTDHTHRMPETCFEFVKVKIAQQATTIQRGFYARDDRIPQSSDFPAGRFIAQQGGAGKTWQQSALVKTIEQGRMTGPGTYRIDGWLDAEVPLKVLSDVR